MCLYYFINKTEVYVFPFIRWKFYYFFNFESLLFTLQINMTFCFHFPIKKLHPFNIFIINDYPETRCTLTVVIDYSNRAN